MRVEKPHDEQAAAADTIIDDSRHPPLEVDKLPIAVLLKLLAARIWSSVLSGLHAGRLTVQSLRASLPRIRPAGQFIPRQDFLHTFGSALKRQVVQKRLPSLSGMRLLPRHCAALLVLLPVLYLTYCIATIPWAARAGAQAAGGALIVKGENGQTIATRGILKGDPIAAEHIPQALAKAVIAIEDRRFYDHGAVDLRAICRAAWHDLLGKHIEGASTITQQLARLRYLSPERSIRRKVQEAVVATWLELRFSKKEILAQYLSAAYFGYGAYGAEAAARRYFSKSPADLSLSEAAMLAGLIRAPTALEPNRYLQRARQRAGEVLEAMVVTGSVSEAEAKAARQGPAQLHVAPDPPSGSNYFLDAVAAEVKSRVGNSGADLIVRTTLNRSLQRLAADTVRKHISAAEKSKNVQQGALIAMTPEGAIVALVGGKDYDQSQFDRATQARRQPGSLFKLFVYLAALRKGFSPDSVVVDRPVRIGDWEPENFDARYLGPVTLRTAFAHSLNSVAVQLAETVGIAQVIETAKRLGIHSDLPAVPSVALGSGTVTLLDMTSAFAAVSANAPAVDPFTVNGVSRGDQILYAKPAGKTVRVDDPAVHAAMMDLLSSTVREGTAKAARWDGPAAGKTGTSQDYRDAWFVGFTSDLVVGVWVGNDDNSSMNGVTGGSIPAAIWHDFVSRAEKLYRPDGRPTVATDTGASVAALSPPKNPEGSSGRSSAPLNGRLKVLRDGSLELEHHAIRLAGVEDIDRYSVRLLRRLVRRRDVSCTPTGEEEVYSCRLDDFDLSSLILLNRGVSQGVELRGDGSEPYRDNTAGGSPRRSRYRDRFRLFRW